MSEHIEITGSCRCGQVRITARRAPMMTFACHCTGCQRMTASAYSLSALYPEDAVTIEGETVLGGMKNPQFLHHVCASCLSWVFTRAPVMGPFVNIRSTMLEGGPADAPPFIETCTDEKRPWVQTGAAHSFPRFPAMEEFGPLMASFAKHLG